MYCFVKKLPNVLWIKMHFLLNHRTYYMNVLWIVNLCARYTPILWGKWNMRTLLVSFWRLIARECGSVCITDFRNVRHDVPCYLLRVCLRRCKCKVNRPNGVFCDVFQPLLVNNKTFIHVPCTPHIITQNCDAIIISILVWVCNRYCTLRYSCAIVTHEPANE